MIETNPLNRHRASISVIVALLFVIAGCSGESSPVGIESDLSLDPEKTLSAKPHCPDDPTHPSCKGDDSSAPGDAAHVPVTFPAVLLGLPGVDNGMIDELGDQTLKHSFNDTTKLNGFNSNYEVRLNSSATAALATSEVSGGASQCVFDSKKSDFTDDDKLALITMMTDASQARYTIVRINMDALGTTNDSHELWATQFQDEALGDVSLKIVDAPQVDRLTPATPGDQSGTYRFSLGTMILRRALGKGGFEKIVCPNQDLVDVVWDFSEVL